MPILNTKLIIDYKNWLKEGQPGLSTTTRQLYFRIARNLLNYLESQELSHLNDINTEILIQFIHVRKGYPPYSPASVKVRKAALDRFFSWAYNKGLVRENAIVGYRRSKIIPRQLHIPEAPPKARDLTVLSPYEQKALLYHLTPSDFLSLRDRFMVVFLLASGLATEELLSLSNKDINWEKGYLEIGGTNKKQRRVDFNVAICKKDYKQWLKVHPLNTQEIFLLFITPKLAPLSVRGLHRAISQYLINVGISKKTALALKS